MGHGKLKKFAENETFRCLLQPDASAILNKEPGSRELRLNDHAIKGQWGKEMFGNDNPIVLELGCGKGDYTIALALRNEFIDAFFGPGEVSEIWLTFSDPQLRGSENARLSSPLFLERYRHFLKPDGVIHLKTDSRYLYEYTKAVTEVNNLQVFVSETDVYAHVERVPEVVTQVQTFYEKMFLDMGLPITYMAFGLSHEGPYAFPGEAFDHEKWLEAEGPRRSFSHQPSKRG